MALEKTFESPLDDGPKEIKPVNPKGNQPWIFIGRTAVEAETPILWPLMWRTDSLEKTLKLGKTEGKKRRGDADEVFGCHHWLSGHEFEQAPGVGDGQGSLVCCNLWGHKELDTTELMNWPDSSLTLLTTSTLALFNSFSSNKPRELFMVSFFLYGIYKDGNDGPVCKTAKETQM